MPALTIITVVDRVIHIYSLILIVRILMSWFPIDRDNPLVQFLYQVTEPFLKPFRDLYMAALRALGVNPYGIGIDFSPILAFLALQVLRQAVIRILVSVLF